MEVLDRKIAPKFNQVETINFLQTKQTRLDNGIEVNYINGGSQEIIKIDFIFNAGNWYNPKPLVASTTNKLLKEGTKNYSAFEIADGIDQYGAFLEVENRFDNSCITLYTLSKHLKSVLPFVKEVVLYPAFSKNEFDIYITNAFEKFKIDQEKVSFLARNQFNSSLFGNDFPYGKVATEDSYKDLTLNDIKEFHSKFYQLANCKILISGNVTETSINELNNFFGHEHIKTLSFTSNIFNIPKNSKQNIHIEKENALQSAIRIGKLVPNKLHPDYFGLKVLNTVLGGYFGSRLMQNIREDKGYTYGIGSGIVSMKNAGYFFISTEVGSNVTKDALKEIYFELERLQSEEISKNELDLVKNYMLGQFLDSCDGAFKMANLFESADEYGLNFDFYNQYIHTIKNITPKTLLELGVKYFNQNDLLEVVAGKL